MTEEQNDSFLARNFGLSKSKKKNKFLDEETWNKLILALENGAYIEDACAYAGINSATFRRWRQRALEENEEFFVEQWQKIIDAEARFKVNSLIRINELGQNNGNLLLKLLSVKYPLQFGEKSSLQVTNVEEVVMDMSWSDGEPYTDFQSEKVIYEQDTDSVMHDMHDESESKSNESNTEQETSDTMDKS